MATYYINADAGNNATGDGSSENPWETINYAFGQASSGDTIICQDSTATYSWVDLTVSKTITFQGESVGGAVWDGGETSVRWYVSIDGLTLTLENIIFQNVVLGGTDYLFTGSSGIDVVEQFTNCVFRDIDLTTQGFWSLGYSGLDLTLTNCLFNDILSSGLYYNALVHLTHPSASTFTFHNCTFYFNADGDDKLYGLFYFAAGTASNVSITTRNTIFKSNVSTQFRNNSGMVEDNQYSCFYGMTAYDSGTGVITSDPLFIDEDNDDFRLRPTSPCIDAGTLI